MNLLEKLSGSFGSERGKGPGKWERRVDAAIQQLQALERLRPKEGVDRNEFKNAGRLLRDKRVVKLSRFEELKTAFVAAKLGIGSEALQDREFRDFVYKRKLYNYLAVYDHTVKLEGGEIFLGPEGKRRNWTEVKAMAAETLPNEGSPAVYPWVYDNEGIRKIRDMCDWGAPKAEDRYDTTAVEVFRVGDPNEWGGGYAFQICTTTEDAARLRGDHTYMRLCTPEGKIYSFGLYDPDKKGGDSKESIWSHIMSNSVVRWLLMRLPFRAKRGMLMSPDVSEFWGVPIQVATIAITKEQFEEKMQAICKDKAEGTRFHLLGDNCTKWALKIARIGKIHIDCKALAPRNLVGRRIVKLTDDHYDKLPTLVQRIGRFAVVVFFNLVSLFGGSFYAENGDASHLNSPFDIGREEKLLIESPHRLGQELIPKINEWQRKECDRLLAEGKPGEAKQARWGLPPASYWEEQQPKKKGRIHVVKAVFTT